MKYLSDMTAIATPPKDISQAIAWHRKEIRRLQSMLPKGQFGLIAETCAAVIGISADLIHNPARLPKVVDFRRIVAYEMSCHGHSINAIARAMQLHRKSIHHYLNSYPDLYQFDPDFRQKARQCSIAVKDILQK